MLVQCIWVKIIIINYMCILPLPLQKALKNFFPRGTGAGAARMPQASVIFHQRAKISEYGQVLTTSM